MWPRSAWALSAAFSVLPHLANSAALRQPTLKLADKVKHLLADVGESVKTAGGDEEVVFATLLTYDQQLKTSLEREIAALRKSVGQAPSHAPGDPQSPPAPVEPLATAFQAAASPTASPTLAPSAVPALPALKPTTREPVTVEEHESARANASAATRPGHGRAPNPSLVLAKVLQDATLASDGTLVLPPAVIAAGPAGNPGWIDAALRRVLTAQAPALERRFQDVLDAFSAPDLQGARVRLTPGLLHHTLAALQASASNARRGGRSVRGRRASRRGARPPALLQYQLKVRRGHADKTVVVETERGILADRSARTEDSVSSRVFSQAILKMDQELLSRIEQGLKTKADLVNSIRDSRKTQLNLINILVDVLQGRYTVDYRAFVGDLSLIETGSSTRTMQSQMVGIQHEIEEALKNKQETHSFLLRIKAMLDGAQASTSDKIQNVSRALSSAWQLINQEHSSVVKAKERCKSENMHAKEAALGVRASMALVGTVQNHTLSAIRASEQNVRALQEKSKAIEASTKDFTTIISKAVAMLEGQSANRQTIMDAVRKAGKLAGRQVVKDPAVPALLTQLLRDMESQEAKERQYRTEQAAVSAAFASFSHGYLQAMAERTGFYGRSLAALRLYASEAAGDTMEEEQAFSADQALLAEGADLCGTIMRLFTQQEHRRQAVSDALSAVLPKASPAHAAGTDAAPDGGDTWDVAAGDLGGASWAASDLADVSDLASAS